MNESHTLNDATGAISSGYAVNPSEFAIDDQFLKIHSHLRLDGIFLFSASAVALIFFWNELSLIHFIALFFVIDILGYYPSVIFSAVSKGRPIPRPFYWLYNFFHSNTGGLCIMLAYVAFGGAVVNAIAIPLHYGIDRGFLGNYLKSYGTKI